MKAFVWLAVAVLCAVATPTFAQTDQGRIAGSVRDQSSAFVANSAVKVKNERTGDERSAVTNEQGHFMISGLKPSTYTIKVERSGFATIEYTALPLAVGQELT